MARVLIGNIPAYGIAMPSLPLARALVEAGHEVDYLLTEGFRARVEATGARLVPYGSYFAGQITAPGHLFRYGRRLFTDLFEQLARRGNGYDVVIAAGVQPRFAELQARVDRPVVFFPPVFLQNARTIGHFARICTGMPAPARHALSSRRARTVLGAVAGTVVLGKRPGDVVRLLGPQSASLNLVNTSRLHQPFAEDFDETCTYFGPTPTLALPDDTFPIDRLREHAGHVVYATMGTVFNGWLPFFRTIADAFAGTDHLVVITTGNPASVERLGPVADNVIVRPFVPQRLVLEEADVCFTHGGFGSATDCTYLGVPPVLTPMGADQFFNAYRLAELDAGRVLPRQEFSIDAVRREAERALAEPPAGLAALRQSFIDAGGPERGVRAVEALLG